MFTLTEDEKTKLLELAGKAYIFCVQGDAPGLNELLEVFNTCVRYAGLQASYVQRGEEYAEWIAPNEAERHAAREFYNQLMGCRSGQEVYDLIMDFRSNNNDRGAPQPGHNED